ncbi:MAG: hypothetical protein RLZZ227_2647 [Pseudomonadota bacterium]|jgi:uncharacterized protein (DUF58 family)
MQLNAGTAEARGWRLQALAAWRAHFDSWVVRRIPPARNIVLGLNNIFIIPNRQGLGFLFVLGLMFIGAVNYEASLAFALVFLLLGMFVLSIFYTFRNLLGLHVTAVPGAPVFAGEKAEITVILNRHGSRSFENVQVAFPDTRAQVIDLLEHNEVRVSLFAPALRRGRLSPGRLLIDTTFPFGTCRAWSHVDLDFTFLVYPRPVECDIDWLLASQLQSGNTTITRGNDDFHSLREYQRGDSLKHVAWKVLARGQGMYTKEYSSNVDSRIWLRWDMFPDIGTEERLSRLCYCVLKLDTAGLDYGLELPGVKMLPAKGGLHYARVLETLALYRLGA